MCSSSLFFTFTQNVHTHTLFSLLPSRFLVSSVCLKSFFFCRLGLALKYTVLKFLVRQGSLTSTL